ncbi:putative serpin-Z12 [Brachypodium distachyon]|uniref:Serpin domain-containing protein n=1 Tax=Brachypodium distachyon TaxID=15368 RepID=I1IMQ3_BRADI|nr:putative serpin-Z12 [Brachypodium distachyon]PNT63973.1 hypothetical protein BRADI_4g23050v3 [Brachypodium distachyon]|eukprot:XP_003576197.1 putative serpin-Z12 [Brachypodium distachyon]
MAAGCLPRAREAGSRAAAGSGKNFVVSPLSIHAALGLVAAGARGDMRQQLLEFLGSPSLDALHGATATELVGKLNGLEQTSFASGVWVDRRRALRPEFMAVGRERYSATAESVDFINDAEKERQLVNAFVKDATKNLISEVLRPGFVSSSTVVVLANALYFKETWSKQPFDPSETFDAPFHTPDGSVVRVPFMTGQGDKHVAVYQGFKALRLPYKSDDGDGRRFYMLLLLPDKTTNLKLSDLYDQAVSTSGFIKNHSPMVEVLVGRFMVPKFKFTFDFEASSDMHKLGLTKPFEGSDFSGMVSSGDGLGITAVHHKATVEVDELGTVAAATTAITMAGSALDTSPPKPRVDFVADRPFLFAIVEERSSAVMFLGHVVNPLDH